jgi:protease-4
VTTEDRAPPRRGLGCLLLAMGGLAMLGVAGVLLATLGGGASSGPRILEEVEESPPQAHQKLAVVEIHGALVDDSRTSTTSEALDMLDRAREDDQVAGVLLRVDTPGGSVTDSDLVHRSVKRLRDAGKPVVVLMGDLCASGGYYVAVAADQIYAMPTTVTGSIGVIIFGLNIYDLLEKVGIQDVSVMSGQFKAMLSPTRPVSEDQRKLLQDIVDSMYQRFVDLVAEGRHLPPDQVRPLADGRLYTADQAKQLHLVDEIGYREDALDKLRDLAHGGPFQVVRYRREATLLDALRSMKAETPTPGAALLGQLGYGPRAMYLYSPLGLR